MTEPSIMLAKEYGRREIVRAYSNTQISITLTVYAMVTGIPSPIFESLLCQLCDIYCYLLAVMATTDPSERTTDYVTHCSYWRVCSTLREEELKPFKVGSRQP